MTDEAKNAVKYLRESATFQWCSDCYVSDGCGDANKSDCHYTRIADLIESLSAELEQVKRERDAAVADMQKTPISLCEACAHYHTGYPCSGGKYVDKINITIACTMFEWRGVKEGSNG